MSEYTYDHQGLMARSVHDAPERSASEVEAERVERVMGSVSRRDLEEAIIILLSAIRTAEGEAGTLDRDLRPLLAQRYQDNIDNIGWSLIENGIDRVVDLLGDEVVDLLEEQA
jgi:hypothetical protein